jgi:deoxyribodipyrimidine photolyase-related protein
MSVHLIFPNQLFELKYFQSKPSEVHLVEEPIYFGYREKRLNFNKLKLVLHRASMKYYESYLKKNNIIVHYHELDNLDYNKIIKNNTDLVTFNVTDHFLKNKLNKVGVKTYLENPNFAVTELQLEEYYQNNKNKKLINQGHFYNWVKEKVNILVETKSYDNENRNPLPNSVEIPVLGRLTSEDKKFLSEAINYINNHNSFKNNCGPTDLSLDNCWFPVTHKSSQQWLLKFIKDRLYHFGDYQDAIRNDPEFKYRHMFHSLIAPMFNIGLISPHQIIKEVIKVKSSSVGINNIEGFIRQILGWREYQRYCYLYYYETMTKSNIFKNKNKLTNSLYQGTTGIPPVDDAIKDAFKYGYLHHIQRLMVISNFFNLLNISPDESYKWFMEFSLDSYDWLMIQNVYSMGMWADGGLTMRKPYISTATYVLNMSNYKNKINKKDDDSAIEWTEIWKALFYLKIISNRNIFVKTPYIFQIKIWDKMTQNEQSRLNNLAIDFTKKIKNE